MRPAVIADVSVCRLVFLDGRLRHLQSQLQHIQGFLIQTVFIYLLDHGGHILLAEGIDSDAPFLQPAFELGYGIRIL